MEANTLYNRVAELQESDVSDWTIVYENGRVRSTGMPVMVAFAEQDNDVKEIREGE